MTEHTSIQLTIDYIPRQLLNQVDKVNRKKKVDKVLNPEPAASRSSTCTGQPLIYAYIWYGTWNLA